MYLENVVIDAQDPQRLGRFWESLLGCTTLTDDPGGSGDAGSFETRLTVADGPTLDLCFEQVDEAPTPDPRLHLEVFGGAPAEQARVVERALALGARHLDLGQRDVPWVVLADPEGNPFCVMEDRAEYAVSGPLSSLPLESADVERDLRFWSELSGWTPTDSAMPGALRHPSGRGPLLELCPERRAKVAGAKNRVHLDLRLEVGEELDDAFGRLVELGGRERAHDWGELPWRVCLDPSGNEVCLLPARPAASEVRG
ncbi:MULTISPECIES: VOC family protein [unclassified Knoellia]|uniref:VOC family protein n=1 Tax=Knoellia altitudinis TaxID=3404795 RepID=UPI00361F7106